MTKEQEKHLKRIKNMIDGRLDFKYRKGAEEHNGDLLQLGNRELIDESINEAIDLLVYLLTLRDATKVDKKGD